MRQGVRYLEITRVAWRQEPAAVPGDEADVKRLVAGGGFGDGGVLREIAAEVAAGPVGMLGENAQRDLKDQG